MADSSPKPKRSAFPRLYWLVVVFEFFERGSYYGMMSVLSVYMTDVLGFAKQDVGLIKGTIQPLLYFLPILAGALADRFGYRRMLMIAFSLLGTGYFLTSQMTTYATVFLSLVVMGFGAGIFKPVISGTIARCTDETNSTLGFGVFYWSINLGAFLFPLVVVPLLRDNVGWEWVILAAAIGTGAMLIPTILAYREPPKPKETAGKPKPNLLQTLANAFEIIYSPFILLFHWARGGAARRLVPGALLVGLLGYGGWSFLHPEGATTAFSGQTRELGGERLVVRGEANLCKAERWAFAPARDGSPATLSLFDPGRLEDYAGAALAELHKVPALADLTLDELRELRDQATVRTVLVVEFGTTGGAPFALRTVGANRVVLALADEDTWQRDRAAIVAALRADPRLAALPEATLDDVVGRAAGHPFLLVFVGLLFLGAFVVLQLAPRFRAAAAAGKVVWLLGTLGLLAAVLWLLPGLSLFARILCSVLGTTLLSLYAIDTTELDRFRDHLRFLVMVAIYSGFWILYFQMFDSVLWYVQAYVDPAGLNAAVNGALTSLGFAGGWRFDVEIVTVVNAFTIILLQLLISYLVKSTRALPTMITGIATATAGMALLALSTGIWVFLAGIVLFSIGEMTAHPKFISYVGQTAPKDRVAMYMGYLFLYGVIGSSIGSVLGANLYVKFVDELNRPRTLWLVFAAIGAATVVGLLLYDRFVTPRAKPAAPVADGG